MSDLQVRIPDLGDAQDVEVVEICVEVGDRVNVDDALIVIESDKASMEVPSPADGEVTEISVKLGDMIETDDLIVTLSVAATDIDVKDDPVSQDEAQEKSHSDGDGVLIETNETPSDPSPTKASDGESVETSARFEIRLPELGDVDDVEVVEVLVTVGQDIDIDQPIVVLESDKATMELPSPVQGKVEELAVNPGDMVTDHSLIAVIQTTTVPSEIKTTSIIQEGEARETSSVKESEVLVSNTPTQPSEDKRKTPGHIYAGPAVRRLSRELGVDLTKVEGSGSKGRITKDDIKHYVKAQMQQTQAASSVGIPEVSYPDFSKFGEVEEVPLTRIQARGARNLVPSWLNVVHVTQHDEADVTELEEFRAELNEREQYSDIHLTILPFILKAAAATLHAHPRFNASIHPSLDRLLVKKYINVGMAVDTPEGLVVPVIRDVLDKGLREIAIEVEHLSESAREKKLTPDEISGATFTVSSLGRLGGTGFTPIVNAPEIAILGVARLATKPIWDGEKFEPRFVLPLSLSYDHRAINGAEAGRFMQSLAEKLTDVRLLIL